jgi:hypothetical protein
MTEIVFALYNIVPNDDNKLSKLFAAFLAVYIMLRRMEFAETELTLLQARLFVLHR